MTEATMVLTDDQRRLYAEEAGTGPPVLFIHEFAGDFRSWEPQVRAFARRYRCLTYNARGYPPSDVPTSLSAYSQERAVADAVAVLEHFSVASAHVIGLSMGAFCALRLALSHPDRVRSAVVAGCGYGSPPEHQATFREECDAIANALAAHGAAGFAERYALGPARIQLRNKDPRGWAEFAAQLADHSPLGLELTIRGVQRRRPSLHDSQAELCKMRIPAMILVGDEDEGALDTSLLLKRSIPSAGLAVFPRTGHACNLEEPNAFNQCVMDFIGTVEQSGWTSRDPRSIVTEATGIFAGEGVRSSSVSPR